MTNYEKMLEPTGASPDTPTKKVDDLREWMRRGRE